MKNKILIITILVLLLIAIATSAKSVLSEPDQFIIAYADDVGYVSTIESSELNSLISEVGPRIVVEYANDIKYPSLLPIPGELQDLLEQVPEHFVIQYANANKFHDISYPIELIGDDQPPQISDISAYGNGLIQWQTDEYAACEINYGVQSGIYPYTISDPLFLKSHQIQLIDLTPGITYYYIISCVDRSGNSSESTEQSFIYTYNQITFIPLALRK